MVQSPRILLTIGLLLSFQGVQAQIYTCTAPDGSRVFSDQKCGPDAKKVPGITTQKRTSNAPRAAKSPAKSPEELQALMQQCNTGDVKACTAWTHGGGPNYLREQESKAKLACDSGSLRDCETRYCSDGASEECRQRVMQNAKISGHNWYLRETAQRQDDGSILYNVRCIQKGIIHTLDMQIVCGAVMGPRRCYAGDSPDTGFARLDQVAGRYCSGDLRAQSVQ